MAEIVINSTSQMSEADVRAIAIYLKSLPASAPEPEVTPPPEAAMASGKAPTPMPALPVTRRTARARRGSIRRCRAMRCCNRPIPPRP